MNDALKNANEFHGIWGVLFVLLPIIGVGMYLISVILDWIYKRKK